jgi:hypothetical protein
MTNSIKTNNPASSVSSGTYGLNKIQTISTSYTLAGTLGAGNNYGGNMKHTPGPWKMYHEINVQGKGGEFIASCGFNAPNAQNSLEIAKANARLISVAPDLLKACKYALSDEQSKRIQEVLRKAIAKAEGVQP